MYHILGAIVTGIIGCGVIVFILALFTLVVRGAFPGRRNRW